jgi:hypothetical protein
MDNLIRIKLDPKRGVGVHYDFIRPCFIVHDWPGDEVDAWFSDDNGSTWDKLDSAEFKSGYDFGLKRLYISLLFDVNTISQLALFGSGGTSVGVGFTLTDYDLIPVGWNSEGAHGLVINVGCSVGNDIASETGSGVTIQGNHGKDFPVGYFVKRPYEKNFPTGFKIAAPNDTIVPAGFNLGTVLTESQGTGVTIMGLSEFGMSFFSLDQKTVNALSGEAVHNRQKTITLNGTTSEDLD